MNTAKSAQAGTSSGPTIGVLVGNKCDYRDGAVDTRVEVLKGEAESMAASLGLAYFEASAVIIYCQ